MFQWLKNILLGILKQEEELLGIPLSLALERSSFHPAHSSQLPSDSSWFILEWVLKSCKDLSLAHRCIIYIIVFSIGVIAVHKRKRNLLLWHVAEFGLHLIQKQPTIEQSHPHCDCSKVCFLKVSVAPLGGYSDPYPALPPVVPWATAPYTLATSWCLNNESIGCCC